MAFAYTTLVTNDEYALGALALVRSLRRLDVENDICVMITSRDLDLTDLEAAGCQLLDVTALPLSDSFKQRHTRQAQHAVAPFTKGTKPLFHDPLDNFCKLRLWEMEQYERIVFIDADAIVLRDVSKLFAYPEFSAAPNLYGTLDDMHRLNSGVFVAEPSKAKFERMLLALDQPDVFWRRTDQTFFESYFPDWHGLPYIYNTLQYIYINLPQLWNWPAIRILHYQYEKPWEHNHSKYVELKPLVDLWHTVLAGSPIPEYLDTTTNRCT